MLSKIAVFCLLAVLLPSGLAQESRATITGTIKDSTGSLIVGATLM
jgi:hypothetical protein